MSRKRFYFDMARNGWEVYDYATGSSSFVPAEKVEDSKPDLTKLRNLYTDSSPIASLPEEEPEEEPSCFKRLLGILKK